MKSKGMGMRLGAMVLLLTVAGPAGPFAAADAAPPRRSRGRSSRRGSRRSPIGGAGARTTSSERST